MKVPPLNPALPPRKVAKIPSRFRPPGAAVGETVGHGPQRVYLDVQARPPDVAYPPRPVPGSVADLDIIMDLCEYPSKVRVSCLAILSMSLISYRSMSATA
jgi:DDB1- and CUL4-associated factor 13